MNGFLKKIATMLFLFVTSSFFIYLVIIFRPRKEYTYVVRFEEPVSGLVSHAGVFIGGIRNGYVHSIENDKEDLNHSIVLIKMYKRIEEPKKAVVKLAQKALSGQTMLNIHMSPTEMPHRPINDLKLDIIEQLAWKSSTGYAVSGLAENLTSLTGNKDISKSMANTVERIDKILSGLEGLITNLNQDPSAAMKVRSILDDVDSIVKEVKKNMPYLIKTFSSLSKLISRVEKYFN